MQGSLKMQTNENFWKACVHRSLSNSKAVQRSVAQRAYCIGFYQSVVFVSSIVMSLL